MDNDGGALVSLREGGTTLHLAKQTGVANGGGVFGGSPNQFTTKHLGSVRD